ncbi:retrotransposon protein, putative, ty1-copia subclass [Tanacetum coccineum]
MTATVQTPSQILLTRSLDHPDGVAIPCLDNFYYAPIITGGVVLISRLVDNGFVQRFTDYGISVSKNDVLYFNVIPRDGIYVIDMLNLVPNVNSIYNVSNKRAKHNLDSTYLWHYRLVKRIEKLQHDGILKSTDNESFDQCVSCLFGMMTRKPFPHQTKRATDLLGLIHTDFCGPLRHVLRQGASCFITFTNDISRYGYVYLLKHKHEVFETFKLTPLYTPQHNGMSERRNRTLLDRVRSMMNLTTLPLSFWDYALESATRILNMVPTNKDTQRKQWVTTSTSYLKTKLLLQDTILSKNTSEHLVEAESLKPQEDVAPIRRSRLVDLPPNAKTVGSKWLFKKKTDMYGNVHTYKARFVAKGYTQTYGIDYEESFSPVAEIRAIRILIAIEAYYDYKIWKMDVKNAFLNSYLNKDIYMGQPKGFIDLKHPRKVFKLQRSIYGLKQASRSWNKRLDEEIKKFDFTLTLIKKLNPGEDHWTVVKNIHKNLRNTKDMFLVYGGNLKEKLRVTCYCNTGLKANRDDIKSQTRYVFVLNGGVVDWKSSKQSTTTISATEAEYIAASEAAMEAVWIRKFVSGLDIVPTNIEPIKMYCDNSATILIANEPGVHKGVRHYHKRYHYVRECIKLSEIDFQKLGDDIDIQFGREEFCLVTGLRFGVDFSSLYLKGPIPFRRRVFDSAMDGYHITASQEHRNNVPDWCLRLVNNRQAWDLYPWGSYILPTLYNSLRNTNVKHWPVFYATPVEEGGGDPPKYTLSGFTWAFKSFILEQLFGVSLESFIEDFSSVFLLPRLTPNAFEARADWWVSSRAFFDGHIREPPRIPSPVNFHSRDDPPVDIYRCMEEQDRTLKELKEKNVAHEEMYNKMNKFLQSSPYLATVDPIGQYGSSHNRDVGGVIPNVMNQERRVVRPSMYFQSPYTNLPDTTVAPKKQPDKSKNKARNGKAPSFDLGNMVIDDNAVDDEVMITDCHIKGYRVMELFWRELVPDLYMGGYYKVNDAGNVGWLSDDQINAWMELIIRNRPHGARFTVAKVGTASKHPGSQMFVIETDEHIKGTLDGSTRPYPSRDDVDWVSVYADKCRRESLEWTKTVNGILEYLGHFERTRRQPYNFQYFYNQGLHFQTPQQANFSDCEVVTCWLIYKLSVGEDPMVYGDRQ